MQPIDSSLYIDRIIHRYHKYYLVIDYTAFDQFLTAGAQEADLAKAA
jgi:hypothetical protein